MKITVSVAIMLGLTGSNKDGRKLQSSGNPSHIWCCTSCFVKKTSHLRTAIGKQKVFPCFVGRAAESGSRRNSIHPGTEQPPFLGRGDRVLRHRAPFFAGAADARGRVSAFLHQP